jgi:hypothetical protein
MNATKHMTQEKGIKVVAFLANHGESTEYRIRVGTRMFHSTTQKTIADLLGTGLIKEHETGEIGAGRTRKYWLPFKGIVEFLHYLGDNPTQIDLRRVQTVVQNFNKRGKYPLFHTCENLRVNGDVSIFRILVDTGWTLVEAPPPHLLCDEFGNPIIESIASARHPEARDYWKYISEDRLMYAFSFIFFAVTGRTVSIDGSSDNAILEHLENVCERYRQSLARMISTIDEIEDYWTTLFESKQAGPN